MFWSSANASNSTNFLNVNTNGNPYNNNNASNTNGVCPWLTLLVIVGVSFIMYKTLKIRPFKQGEGEHNRLYVNAVNIWFINIR